jgi:penicillin-binding protein-related factor A (putative recombinase)
MIKKCQIEGLKKWSKHIGIFGFVFNFRSNNNRTFFVSIKDFITYTSSLSKKSINIDDILEMNPIEIKNEKIRVNYKYDIENFLKNTRI